MCQTRLLWLLGYKGTTRLRLCSPTRVFEPPLTLVPWLTMLPTPAPRADTSSSYRIRSFCRLPWAVPSWSRISILPAWSYKVPFLPGNPRKGATRLNAWLPGILASRDSSLWRRLSKTAPILYVKDIRHFLLERKGERIQWRGVLPKHSVEKDPCIWHRHWPCCGRPYAWPMQIYDRVEVGLFVHRTSDT